MPRTIAQIQQEIINAKNAEPALASLTAGSRTATWQLFTYIMAATQWATEALFDKHEYETNQLLQAQKPHTKAWYVAKAKAYQYGRALLPERDVYATPATDPAIAIVHHAAAVEAGNVLRLKVAGTSAGSAAPLSSPQLSGLVAYMALVKDAGVRLQITSTNADVLQLQLTIYYHPLILTATGSRIDGTAATPVKDTILGYLAQLPFNGMLILNHLIATLQAVDGVLIAHIQSAAAAYSSLPFSPIAVEYTPDAGYMVLDEAFFDTHITYTAHAPL